MNFLAIIPARRDSSRFPHKNSRPFIQHQGVNYSLTDAALAFTNDIPVNAVMLTTDYPQKLFPMACQERIKGKKFLFRERPLNLHGGDVQMWEVVDDCLTEYFGVFQSLPDAFILLQPTSPIRDHTVVLQALNLYTEKGVKAVCTVNPAYKPNGNVYMVDTDLFRESHSFFPEGLVPIFQEPKFCIDIDTEQDFRMAQHIIETEFEFRRRRW